MNSQTHHGQNLEALFLKLRKTKEEAAALMGYAPAYLSRYYKQESIPRKILVAAASTFGVDVADFDLPPTEFEKKLTATPIPPPTDWQAEAARLDAELRAIKDRYIALLEKVNAEKEGGDKEKLEYILQGR